MATTGDKRQSKPQAYSFVRHKIPRGFSYPLKRSELDVVLEQRALPEIESVVFYFRRNPESIFRVD